MYCLGKSDKTSKDDLNSSLWLTGEFFGYYIIVIYALFTAAATAYKFSSPDHPSYQQTLPLLSKGWLIPGRLIDDSDAQWSGFRNSLYKIIFLLSIFTIINRLLAEGRNLARSLLSLAGIYLLHGSNIIKFAFIIIPCYFSSSIKTRFLGPFITWTLIISTLFIIENVSWTFSQLSDRLNCLDRFVGLYPRWNIIFKISCLRIISFSLDRYWFIRNQLKENCSSDVNLEYCKRQEDFTISNYISYLFFLPLYFAGPIISFNDFVLHLKEGNKEDKYSKKQISIYFFRLVLSFIMLEFFLHIFHPVAIKQAKAFNGFTPLDFGVLAYFNLNVIWLKLLIIWRFFRFFSLLNGIEPPENMVLSQLIIFFLGSVHV